MKQYFYSRKPLLKKLLLPIVFFILSIQFVHAQQPKLVLPVGHTAPLRSAEFSSDGKNVITVSADGTAKLWETSSGKLLTDFKPTGDASIVLVNSAVFSPGGKMILVEYEYYSKVIETNTGLELQEENYSFTDLGSKLAPDNFLTLFSPDGRRMIVFDNNNYQPVVINTETKKTLFTLHGVKDDSTNQSFSTYCAYSPDGKMIATLFGHSIRLWNANTGKLIQSYHSIDITNPDKGFRFNADNKKLELISDGPAAILNLQTGTYKSFFKENEFNYQAEKYKAKLDRFSPGGKFLLRQYGYSNAGKALSTGDLFEKSVYDSALVWDVAGNKLLYRLSNLQGMVLNNDTRIFSPDGENVIIPSNDRQVKVRDTRTGKVLLTLAGHSGNIITACYREDGKYILTTAADKTVKYWNASNGLQIRSLQGHQATVNDARFSPDGKKIITASADNTAQIWDAESGTQLMRFAGHLNSIKKAWFGNDSKQIVFSSDMGIKTWDPVSGNIVFTSSMQKEENQSFPDSFDNTVISSDSSFTVVWRFSYMHIKAGIDPDLTKGDVHSLDEKILLRYVQFSPDNKKLIITYDDSRVAIYDLLLRKYQYTFIALDSFDYIALLPDGYYKGTTDAAKLLHFITPDSKVISFEQLDVKYNRPDEVLSALSNSDTLLIRSYRNAYMKRIKKLGIDTASFKNDYSVPEADFVNREMIAAEQHKRELKLHLKAVDSIYKLDRFNIWVNEVPLFGLNGANIKNLKTNFLDTSIIINLSDGSNRIESSITNINGIESYRKPIMVNYLPVKPANPKTWFIGIGINNYTDTSMNLKWCVQDIRDLVKVLQQKCGKGFTVLDTLFNEKVSLQNIRELKNKLRNTGINDKVIISYSGHGLFSKTYDYYLSSYNINFSKPEEGGILYDELESLLDYIPARKKLLLLDACNSGEVDKEEMKKLQSRSTDLAGNNITMSTSTRGTIVTNNDTNAKIGLQKSFELMQSLFVNVGKGTGTVIIAASGGAEFAQEKSTLGHGVFTYSVIRAIQQNQSISVSELKKIVGKSVIELTKGLQKPTSRNETISVDWNVW